MINKNKEEIEKILKKIEKRAKFLTFHNKSIQRQMRMCDFELRDLMLQLQERIKTSIEWCEDEIEFLENLTMPLINNSMDSKINQRFYKEFEEKKEQLQSHLKWLKQKRGQK